MCSFRDELSCDATRIRSENCDNEDNTPGEWILSHLRRDTSHNISRRHSLHGFKGLKMHIAFRIHDSSYEYYALHYRLTNNTVSSRTHYIRKKTDTSVSLIRLNDVTNLSNPTYTHSPRRSY